MKCQLCDIFRILNPDTHRNTWRKMILKGIKQMRLDYFTVPNNMLYNINNIAIGHSIYSDRSPVSLHFRKSKYSQRGRGCWKLNTEIMTWPLLHDQDYITKINELLDKETLAYKKYDHKRNSLGYDKNANKKHCNWLFYIKSKTDAN